MSSFKDYHFKDELMKAISGIGFSSPTEIQKLVIPRALKKQSLVVQSATGSGKTHSFLIPILENLDVESSDVEAVIISPTRELAMQLFDVLSDLVVQMDSKVRIARAIGGSSRDQEIKKYEKTQPHIVVGTLGRLSDLVLDANVLKIHNAKTVVIDEADMIFEEKELVEVDKIMGKVQGKPQFLVFSATIPKGLRSFLGKYLENVETISKEEKNLTVDKVEHRMLQCKAKDKKIVLLDLLKVINPYLCLIFANTKETVDELSMYLAKEGFKVGKLHGAMDDRQRKQMIKRIHDLEFKYVVASDIAARGIDIIGVSHVINFDLPKEIEFFIHRTGRTARNENTGISFSLYAYEDDEYIKNLQVRGLVCKFYQIKERDLVECTFKKTTRKISPVKMLEQSIHMKHPVPKKVKPGYKKKRKEKIEKEFKKAKKERISEIYRKRAKRGNENENR